MSTKKEENLGELVVMFDNTAQIDLDKNSFRSLGRKDLTTLNKSVSRIKAKVQPIFNPQTDLKTVPKDFADFTAKTRINPLGFFSIQAKVADLESARAEFLRDSSVIAAYVKPPAEDPDFNWLTPDFSGNQGYLDAAPGGVDARFAWKLAGGKGNQVRVVDVEQGFNFDHEDLRSKISGLIAGNNRASSRDHGTAVLGVIAAEDNGRGTTGISNQVKLMAISHNGLGTSQAIIKAADQCQAGDIILLEVHRAGPVFNFDSPEGQRGYIAIEWWPDDFAAVRYATSKGIIVVEAAGNGGENFDLEIYNKRPAGFPNSWRNPFNLSNLQSGAVIVGAGASPGSGVDRTILSFSNWGKRVDVQGWGHNVATTGYGGLQGDKFVSIDPAAGWTVEAGFPKSPVGTGPGFLSAFGNGVDAAFWCDHNQKVYFFKKDQYYRVDPSVSWTAEAGYPKPIAGNWPGMPADFAEGIDAALWSHSNQRIYFFKGNKYVKINPSVSWNVESGYPKSISGNWPGLPASFNSGIDSAIYSYTNDKIYFFKKGNYVRINPSVSWNVEAGYPKPIDPNWKNLPSEFRRGIDAAFWDKTTQKVFFLKNDNLWYTGGFNGTSSASPVVTGALACIQGRLKARGKTILTSFTAQQLMRSTGSPQMRLSGIQETDADSNWKGINASFSSGLDAALWNGKSNMIYFFKGSQYVKVNPNNNWNIEPGYPKPIDGNWPGLPSGFTSGINAALWSDTNKKVYLFKGSQFVRIDPFNDWKMDSGYPKPIAGNWPGMPAGFASGVDDALYSFTNKKIYFFKGSEYVRINPAVSWDVEPGYPKPISGNWPGLPADFNNGIDAAVWSGTNQKIYLFKGEKYVRINPSVSWDMEAGYPAVIARQRIGNRPNLKQVFEQKGIASNWPGFPASFGSGLNASLWSETNKKVYFFKGNQFVRVDPFNNWEMDAGYPKPIAGNWPGMPSGFSSGVDAALFSHHNGKIYFFKGSQYVRIDPAVSWNVEAGYPKPIAGNWPNIPANFATGIDACFFSTKNNRIYMFKGNSYIRINPASSYATEAGYPSLIQGPWRGIPASFESGLDAVLWNEKSKRVYFFKGNQYLKINPDDNWTMEAGYPLGIIN